jgi:outer membrane receptor protein involved in Fe transport
MKSHRHGAAQPKIHVSTAVALALACAAQMRVAMAAAPTNGDGGRDPDSQMLQEITVTANRREESVLSVPYNISALTGSELQRSGAGDVQSLSTLVPGLQAPNEGLRGGQLPQFTIRGLNVSPNGDSSTTPGGEAPLVSVYSDNTPLAPRSKLRDALQ